MEKEKKERSKNLRSGGRYIPYGAAKKLFEYEGNDEILLSGPAGTGKSRGILEYVVAQVLKYPNSRALIARRFRRSMTQTTLVTLERDVLGKDHPVIQGSSRNYRQQYNFDNGSEIVIGGLDNSDTIMGADYDLIFVSEAIQVTQDAWEDLVSRLRNGMMPTQKIIGDTNPSHARHWLKRRCDRGDCHLIKTAHTDNPMLYNQETMEMTEFGESYIGKLNKLTGVKRKRLKLGLWVSEEGTVYEDFTDEDHVISVVELPEFVARFISIDFGYRNPFVAQWWGLDYDGNLYLYKEIYKTELLVEDAAKLINSNSYCPKTGAKEKYNLVVHDHDAEGAATLRKHLNIDVRRYKNAIKKPLLGGIEAVQKRIELDDRLRPSLYICDDILINEPDETLVNKGKPTRSREELDVYMWDKSGKTTKEHPVKENDHACDAMRYMVAELDGVTSEIEEIDFTNYYIPSISGSALIKNEQY